MTIPVSASVGTIRSALGKVLSGACRADYLFDGHPDPDDFGPLQLEFACGSVLVMELDRDGETVTADDTPLTFRQPEPDCNVWKRIDLSGDSAWTQLVGTQVTAGDVWVWDAELIVGWRVWFGSHWICYWNAGDCAKFLLDEEPNWPTDDCNW